LPLLASQRQEINTIGAGGVAQVVEYLPGQGGNPKFKRLYSQKKKKREREKEITK
jgi:hypothetical protein